MTNITHNIKYIEMNKLQYAKTDARKRCAILMKYFKSVV